MRVESPHGHLEAPVRVGDVRPGTVFAPFHYGWFDGGDASGRGPGAGHRAANELTPTEWDPVSKQPVFKTAAVRMSKVADGDGPSPAPTTTASRPARTASRGGGRRVPVTVGGASAEVRETFPPVEPPAVATREERP